MILTAKQEEGLKIAVARYKAHEAYTCISGYAGTGKSTLIKFIIAALGLEPEQVCYVAYTGKAAQVLKQKGCSNPYTAHKLLYKAKPMPNGTFKFEPKPALDEGLEVIIVDEVSMLPKEMWLRLLSHRIHVIACGDPFQLPPIDKDSDNHVLDNPHIFLDEIMRQAYDSEIIRFSMWIREGKPINEFPASGQQVMFVKPEEIVTGMYDWADQILCATNAKRNAINMNMRQIKGFGPEPAVGDKIISLRNQWEFFSNSMSDPAPLTNGTIGVIQNTDLYNMTVPFWISEKKIPILYTNMIDENGDVFHYIPVDYTSLTTGEKFLTGKQEFQMRKNPKCPDPPFEFAYAYGITCHKAQGSEWGKVMVYEERFPYDKEEHARWAYTAATRASEKLVWVVDNK
jgi:exodeoxyribonuclease-5